MVTQTINDETGVLPNYDPGTASICAVEGLHRKGNCGNLVISRLSFLVQVFEEVEGCCEQGYARSLVKVLARKMISIVGENIFGQFVVEEGGADLENELRPVREQLLIFEDLDGDHRNAKITRGRPTLANVNSSAAVLYERCQQLLESVIEKSLFTFELMSLTHFGRAIHMSIVNWGTRSDSEALFDGLIRYKASVEEPCYREWYGRVQLLRPVHIAAACGRVDALRKLIECKALMDAPSELVDGNKNSKPNGLSWSGSHGDLQSFEAGCRTTALHEAARMNEWQAAEVLIDEGDADVNALHSHGFTPLHIAAVAGAMDVAMLLVQKKALVSLQADDGRTPLAVALDHGAMPASQLFILTDGTFSDLLVIARRSPESAAELVQGDDGDCSRQRLHKQWCKKLVATADQVPNLREIWREFMEIAPSLAEHMLDLLTCAPVVENILVHPVPKRAFMREKVILQARFEDEITWSCNVKNDSNKHTPNWHFHLGLQYAADHESQKVHHNGNSSKKPWFKSITDWFSSECEDWLCGPKQSNCVSVKVLKIPDMACKEVFFALKETRRLHIFTKPATLGLITKTWVYGVNTFISDRALNKAVEVGILLCWVLLPTQLPNSYRFCTWSLLCAHCVRDLWYELLEMRAFLLLVNDSATRRNFSFTDRALRFLEGRVSMGNLLDFGSILVLLALVVRTGMNNYTLDVNDGKELVVAVILSRWLQLMISFRAFSFVGQQLLPIMQSTSQMGGIFCVTTFCFFGFLHAFWSLGANSGEGIISISVNAIRFLLIGDGDGIDNLLELGADGATPHPASITMLCISVFIFVVWIMNLFIAGTDQAYEQALEYAYAGWLQERAAICLTSMCRPCLPWRWRICFHRGSVRFCQFLVYPAVWILIDRDVIGPAVGSIVLFTGSVVIEAIMHRPPWHMKEKALDKKLSKLSKKIAIHEEEKTKSNNRVMAESEILKTVSPQEAEIPVPHFEFNVFDFCQNSIDSRKKSEWQLGGPPKSNDVEMYLWMVYRQDYDEMDYWPSDNCEQNKAEKGAGRLSILKRHQTIMNRRLQEKLWSLRTRTIGVQKQVETVNIDVKRMETEFKQFGRKLDNIEDMLHNFASANRRSQQTEGSPSDYDFMEGVTSSGGFCSNARTSSWSYGSAFQPQSSDPQLRRGLSGMPVRFPALFRRSSTPKGQRRSVFQHVVPEETSCAEEVSVNEAPTGMQFKTSPKSPRLRPTSCLKTKVGLNVASPGPFEGQGRSSQTPVWDERAQLPGEIAILQGSSQTSHVVDLPIVDPPHLRIAPLGVDRSNRLRIEIDNYPPPDRPAVVSKFG